MIGSYCTRSYGRRLAWQVSGNKIKTICLAHGEWDGLNFIAENLPGWKLPVVVGTSSR